MERREDCKSCSPAHICGVASEDDNGICPTEWCTYCNPGFWKRILIRIQHHTTIFGPWGAKYIS